MMVEVRAVRAVDLKSRPFDPTWYVECDGMKVSNNYRSATAAWARALVVGAEECGRRHAPVLVQGSSGAFVVSEGRYPQEEGGAP